MIISKIVNTEGKSGEGALESRYEVFATTDRRRTEPTK